MSSRTHCRTCGILLDDEEVDGDCEDCYYDRVERLTDDEFFNDESEATPADGAPQGRRNAVRSQDSASRLGTRPEAADGTREREVAVSGDLPNGTTQTDLDRHADEQAGGDGFERYRERHADPDDPLNDYDYQRFLAETAAECRACPECWDVPCGACCAGGVCDAICDCDKFRYDDDDGDYDGFPEDHDDG